MYFSHFGLSEAPFGNTPNTSFFYTGCSRGEIQQALMSAVELGAGIVKLTGEAGSGKTMLCRVLETSFAPQVEVVYLLAHSLSKQQFLLSLAREMKLPVAQEAASSEQLSDQLQSFLIKQHAEGKQVLLLVEEAQTLSRDALEQIRLLSNLEANHQKLLKVILFAQPEFDQMLDQANMLQFKERISHSFTLTPIAASQIGDYLLFRLHQAGYRGPDHVFTPAALKQLTQLSQGNFKRINVLVDKAMLAAFANNTHVVGQKQIQAALAESKPSIVADAPLFGNLKLTPSQMGATAIAAIGIFSAGFVLGLQWPAWHQPETSKHAILASTEPGPQISAPIAKSTSTEKPHTEVQTAASAVMQNPATDETHSTTKTANAAARLPQDGSKGKLTDTATVQASTVSAASPNAENAAPVKANDANLQARTGDAAAAPSFASAVGALLASRKPALVQNKTVPVASVIVPSTPPPAYTAAATNPMRLQPALAEKLKESQKWLNDSASAGHSLQLNLVEINKQTELMAFIEKLKKEISGHEVYVYPSRVGGIARYGVLLASFANRNDARIMQKKLKKQFAYQTQVRSVGGLRNEIIRTKSEDLWLAQ